jgi:hypothetical protein
MDYPPRQTHFQVHFFGRIAVRATAAETFAKADRSFRSIATPVMPADAGANSRRSQGTQERCSPSIAAQGWTDIETQLRSAYEQLKQGAERDDDSS